MAEEKQWSWNYHLRPVVEFVRKDAEIAFDINGHRFQKVIARRCATTDEADAKAREFITNLNNKIVELVARETNHLPAAKE